MLKLLTLLLVAGAVADETYGITCQVCIVGLASMTENLEGSNQEMMETGAASSTGCDQIPVKSTRQACRETLDYNFPTFLQKFLAENGTSAQDFCTSMGFCL